MPSFVFDTLCLLSTLVGDPFYLTYYRREYESLEPKFTPEVRQALASLKRQLKDERQLLIGPSLCWLFSLTNDRTLADLLRTVDDSNAMESALYKLNGHNDDYWQAYLPIRSDLRTIFRFLQDIGFESYWRRSILFLMDRVNHHNPSFGYNSFAGYIEEDCVQALEQMASERLQFATEPHKRWKQSDDGMHVFAVALYSVMKDSVMKEEGHNAQNEEFSDFLTRMVRTGKLGPGQIRPLYERFYAEPGHQ